MLLNITPEELPSIVKKFQAIDLRGKNGIEIKDDFHSIIKKMKLDDLRLGLKIAGVLWLGYQAYKKNN